MSEPAAPPAEPGDAAAAGRVGERPRCSAKGCRSAGTTDLQWRNPRLHDAARVKHWVACDAHADSLAGFLARRGFLLERVALAADGPDPSGPDG